MLSIEWNSKRLGGPTHGIATINCTQNSARECKLCGAFRGTGVLE